MASSIKKIKEEFRSYIDDEGCKKLHAAMRAIDGDPLPEGPKTPKGGWSLADKILEGHGVEYIAEGRNARSPAITYINTGDLYTATVLITSNRQTCYVGCVADVIEKGDYE